jgi:sRNA-binding regulator protein Hfq
MWLVALRKMYDAQVAESTAVIDTFLKNSVGVADHDNFMKTVKSQFDKLVHAKHAISEIDNIVKIQTKTKDK